MPRFISRGAVALLGLAGLLGVLIVWAPDQALAESHFKVENQLINKAYIKIYDGDDSVCEIDLKSVTVEPNSTESMSCKGGDTNRCKISVKVQHDQNKICGDLMDTCDSSAIKTPDGATLILKLSDYRVVCTLDK